MIINNRKDLDAAPADTRERFIASLAASINQWKWEGGDWVIRHNTTDIERYGVTLDDFPDAPVPDMPDYNPDERALEQARESASLSRADFKLGLLDMGELDNVKAAMTDPNTDPRVVILWEDAERFNRMHPDLLSFAQVMGYSEQQLDQLFGIGTNEININTATADELESLSGVGASLAQQIIDGRPWSSVNDLANISGISEDMVSSWSVTV